MHWMRMKPIPSGYNFPKSGEKPLNLLLNDKYRNKGKTMKYQIEIRAGEGGDDAKLFVGDLMTAYINWFDREN
jgi:protein subunit release factor A